MIELESQLKLAFEALTGANVPHALIGGLAMARHGAPRATADIDLLIDEEQKTAAFKALSGAGYVLRAETDETAHFGGTGALDVLLARRALTRAMLSNSWGDGRHQITPSVEVEDIIGLKIQAFSNDPRRWLRDQADIEALIAANPTLNWDRVKHYADIFDRWPAIEAIRQRLAGGA